MALSINRTLHNAAGNGTSNPVGVDIYPMRTYQVVITSGSPTIVIEGSEDGDNWYEVTSISASGAVSDNTARHYVRSVVSGASGNVKVILTAIG